MSDATSILIVDDEPVARSRLRELLADLAPDGLDQAKRIGGIQDE